MEFDILLERIKTHFSPSEFLEFLDVSWDMLLSNEKMQDLIEKNMNELKEEIGID